MSCDGMSSTAGRSGWGRLDPRNGTETTRQNEELHGPPPLNYWRTNMEARYTTLIAPVRFDALWCSENNRVRVATVGASHYVSVDGADFFGPHESLWAAREYDAKATGAKAKAA